MVGRKIYVLDKILPLIPRRYHDHFVVLTLLLVFFLSTVVRSPVMIPLVVFGILFSLDVIRYYSENIRRDSEKKSL